MIQALSQGLSAVLPSEPLAPRVSVLSTTRQGGYSQGPYAGLNLGDHVNDDPEAVAANRRQLCQVLGLAAQPPWLSQVHGIEVVQAERLEIDPAAAPIAPVTADAIWTQQLDQPIAIMTADCLPVVLAHREGLAVGAAHAGWRGLADGVIESLLDHLPYEPCAYRAWFGPAIGALAFEVGDEVRHAFLSHDARAAEAFVPSPQGRWLADLRQLATQRLAALGVDVLQDSAHCTVSEAEHFHSYRRDGQRSGRMVTLAWLSASQA